ncbi:hypothetical protein EJB05_56069, partial [Eragrostis curvula]
MPLFLLLSVETIGAAKFNITNRCSFTVWPAASPGGGGVKLEPGESWALNVPAGTGRGSVWARTGCSFDNEGNGSCQTGDCGGVLACTGSGNPPVTMAEYYVGKETEKNFFDISLADGFNVPMDFLPVPANGLGGQGCSKGPRCAANISSQCPSELKTPGGCNSACTVYKQDKYCCTGTVGVRCEPTKYSVFFIRMCPDAYGYALDDSSSTVFTCPSGTNYQIVFCPPIDISASPPAKGSPASIVTRKTPMNSSSFTRSKAFGVILEKADVYSFGVVVMEIISGRKNLDTSRSEESIHLITLLEEKVKSTELADLIDKNSSDMQAHKQEVIDMMNLAMWCLQIDCKNRPRMSEVVKVLEGNMNAESNIEHNFVATSATMFSIAENIGYSDPPLASVLSGPR